MTILNFNRYQAFGIHFLISGLIFIGLTSVIVFFWYPQFLFTTDGGWQGIRIIAGVDLVIGPLLTLILYKKGKRGLKFDLICIGVVQLACLVAGTYIVYQERPIVVLFSHDTFYSMAKSTFARYHVNYRQIEGLSLLKPTWLYVDMPTDPKERRQLLARQLQEGLLYTKTERYRPFRDHLADVLAHGKRWDELPAFDTDLANHDQVKYFDLISRYGRTYVGLDVKSGKPVSVLSKPVPPPDENAAHLRRNVPQGLTQQASDTP